MVKTPRTYVPGSHTPEQAQAYLDLENSEDYQKEVIQKEIDLINENITKILKKTGTDPMNIIDQDVVMEKKQLFLLKILKIRLN